jgi:hypothetical protein
MIALVIAFPASELLLSHCSLITSTQIILPQQQCQLLPTERIIFMISSAAKSRSSALNKTFREFWLKTQPPPPMKTESTMNSLPMNLWLKVAMPMNACSNVTTIMMADDTVDTDTCKIHTQWHTNRYFGGPMQSNTETGERGLKTWAKKVARTALKHRRDVFTQSTSNRVGEMLLLNTASELVMRKQVKKTKVSTSGPAATRTTVIHRTVPHFRFKTEAQEVISLNQQDVETVPDTTTGIIQREVSKALSELEGEKSQQRFFDIWCEAALPSGQIVRCWPQYRGNQGCKYDWVLAKFQLDDEGDKGVVPYLAKVLAMYKDIDGKFKVLVHSVAYKTVTNIEGPYGDSRLVRHYRLEFNDRSGDPNVYSLPFKDIVKCVVAYESVKYQEPLILQVRE